MTLWSHRTLYLHNTQRTTRNCPPEPCAFLHPKSIPFHMLFNCARRMDFFPNVKHSDAWRHARTYLSARYLVQQLVGTDQLWALTKWRNEANTQALQVAYTASLKATAEQLQMAAAAEGVQVSAVALQHVNRTMPFVVLRKRLKQAENADEQAVLKWMIAYIRSTREDGLPVPRGVEGVPLNMQTRNLELWHTACYSTMRAIDDHCLIGAEHVGNNKDLLPFLGPSVERYGGKAGNIGRVLGQLFPSKKHGKGSSQYLGLALQPAHGTERAAVDHVQQIQMLDAMLRLEREREVAEAALAEANERARVARTSGTVTDDEVFAWGMVAIKKNERDFAIDKLRSRGDRYTPALAMRARLLQDFEQKYKALGGTAWLHKACSIYAEADVYAFAKRLPNWQKAQPKEIAWPPGAKMPCSVPQANLPAVCRSFLPRKRAATAGSSNFVSDDEHGIAVEAIVDAFCDTAMRTQGVRYVLDWRKTFALVTLEQPEGPRASAVRAALDADIEVMIQEAKRRREAQRAAPASAAALGAAKQQMASRLDDTMEM